MATGHPCRSPKATTSSGEVSGSERPGTPATPTFSAASRGTDLVPHDLDGLGWRADEGHAQAGDGAREVGVLGEEAVARVDAVGAALVDGLEDRLGVEVALGRRLAAEGVRLVCHAHVEGVAIQIRVDGDRRDAELTARPDDPDGDFAAVCDEDLLEHAGPFRRTGSHNCTRRMVSAMWGGAWDVRWFDEVDSTNTYVRDQARRGAPAGLVVVADHQTAGRGRLDRRWESPPGANLLASVLLRPQCEGSDVHLCTGAVALAAVDACREVAGVEPVLKWPNDLLVAGSKLAGVLAEAEFSGGTLAAVVVGIGVNVAWPGPQGAGGTCLDDLGTPTPPVGRRVLLDHLLGALARARRRARRRRGTPGPGRRGAAALCHPGPAGAGRPGQRGVHRDGGRHRRRRAPGRRDRVGTAPGDGRRRGPPSSRLGKREWSGPRPGPGLTWRAICAFSSREVPVSSGRISPATGSKSTPRTTWPSMTSSPTPATDPTCPT